MRSSIGALFITEDTGLIADPLARIMSFGNYFWVPEPGALLLSLSGLVLLTLVFYRPTRARGKAQAAAVAAFCTVLVAAGESRAALIKGWEYSIIATDTRLSLPALDSDQIAYMRTADPVQGITRIETFDPLAGTQLVAETFSPTPPDRFPLAYQAFFPDESGNTRFLGRVSLDNGQVAFTANAQTLPPDDNPVIQGVFVGGLGPRTVATTAVDQSPSLGEGTFQGFPGLRASISGGNVVFNGFGESGPGATGIYADFGGTLQRVADTSTAVPPSPGTSGDAGHFTSLSLLPALVGSNVVFSGRGSIPVPSSGEGFDGIYLAILGGQPASLLALVTDDTKIPGTDVSFGGNSFATTPAFDGTSVAFFGQASGGEHSGIYLADRFSGLVTLIADTNTLVPGKDTTFSAFRDTDISIDRGNVVFVAETADGPGIYMYVNGSLIEVAEAADLAFPNFETIIALGLQGEALDGRDVVFWAEAIGEGGVLEFIILASIPIPATLWLVGLALMVMFRMSRKS